MRSVLAAGRSAPRTSSLEVPFAAGRHRAAEALELVLSLLPEIHGEKNRFVFGATEGGSSRSVLVLWKAVL